MIWKIKYKERWRQGFSNDRAVERVKGEEVREGAEAAVGRGQSAKFVKRKTLMLCIVWKMTWFPSPDGSFFQSFTCIFWLNRLCSDTITDVRTRGLGSCFLTNAGWYCSWVEVRVCGSSSNLFFWGNGRITPGQPIPPLRKMEEPWLPVWLLFVIWKTNTSAELSVNRCCKWLDPGSYGLCWNRGRLFLSRSALLSCQLRVGSREIMSYVYYKELRGQ